MGGETLFTGTDDRTRSYGGTQSYRPIMAGLSGSGVVVTGAQHPCLGATVFG